ncbi:DUF397 domain-containing protein [Lentzea sp. NPDC058450]|uniref:DUF397 domain-containing protein n=1 Tax=Lentzea sp. NPDC058450 TaxID=3346505 RepID=UPI003653EB9B
MQKSRGDSSAASKPKGAFHLSIWRKSSYSDDHSECVEVGHGQGIRDSKAPTTHLPLSREAWTAFLQLVNRLP